MPSVWMDPQSLADLLGLPIEVLANWRMTDVGPSYVKLTPSAKGQVRYRRDTILEWQKSCLRVVPESWQLIGAFPCESAPSEPGKVEWLPPGRAAIAVEIPIATLTAWRRRTVGIPFVWIGGGGQHQVMYDRAGAGFAGYGASHGRLRPRINHGAILALGCRNSQPRVLGHARDLDRREVEVPVLGEVAGAECIAVAGTLLDNCTSLRTERNSPCRASDGARLGDVADFFFVRDHSRRPSGDHAPVVEWAGSLASFP
jgi:hypothetical protein